MGYSIKKNVEVRLREGKFITYSLEKYPRLRGILTILPDHDGSLWVGTTDSGLSCLKDGEFTFYTTHDGLKSNRICSLREDKNGRLWIATSAGLSIRDSSGKIRGYTGKDGPSDKYIFSIYKTKKEEVWLGCMNGLYCLKDGKVTYYGKKEGLPNLKVRCLYEDSDQSLWAGTDGDGLIRIKNGRIEAFPSGDRLASGYIYSIHEDRENNLWIGTLYEGLLRLSDTTITTYTTREGLNNNIVNCIIEDRKGSLRIGTDKGVNRLNNGQLTREWPTNEWLSNNRVTTLMEDHEGALWIGTEVGLGRDRNGKLERFQFNNDGYYSYILQLWEDKRGAVWIFTAKDLRQFYNGKFSVFIYEKEFSKNYFGTLCLDRQGSIWVGTYGGGLYRLKEGRLTAYTTNEGLVHNEVECFYEDKKGILYIGTRGGLSLWVNEKFTNYTTQSGLIDNLIYQIIGDDLGYLWLFGITGLSRISEKELSDFTSGRIEKIKPLLFNESDGIKNPICESSIKTWDGKLWFATNEGLAVIDPCDIKKNTLPPPVVIEELIVDGETFPIRESLIIPPGKKRLEFYYTGLSFVKSQQIKFKLKLEGYDSDWVDVGHARSTIYTGLSPRKYTFRVKACNSDGVWNEKGASISFYLKPYFYEATWFHLLSVLFVLLASFFLYRFRVRQLKNRQKYLATLVEVRTREVEDKNRQLEEQSGKLQEMDQIKSRFFANISHEFRTPLTLIMGPLEQMIASCQDNDIEEKRKLTLMLRNSQRLLRLINQLLELSKLDSGKMKLHAAKTDIIPFLKGIIDSFRLLAQHNELDLVFSSEDEIQPEAEEFALFLDPRKLEDIMANLLVNALKFTPAGGKITVTSRRVAAPSTREDSPISNNVVDLRKQQHTKSFSGVQGAVFQKSPLAAGGIKPIVSRGVPESPGCVSHGYVEISVSDTGPGIPAGDLPYIFDRFYQVESTYELHQKGTGIGLALAKELVELHHGTIAADSREGEGTTFIIRLPLGRHHLAPDEIVDLPTAPTPSPSHDITTNEITTGDTEPDRGKREKDGKEEPGVKKEETAPWALLNLEAVTGRVETDIILVVEDSADMRDYIRGALEPGYTVVDAQDGRDGIQKARDIIPDLIISDIMMPEVDGFELCRVLKSDVNTSHIPIILLTAKAAEENIIQGLETGADDYITKPFNTKILIARIKNLIDLRCQLQKNINREMTLQPVKTSVSTIDREFLRDLHEAIRKNLADEDFNVEQLCKKLYMGRTTLYRKVLALTGETPTDFIRSYRLRQGAELLKQNTGTVLEVALAVGFSNSSYFAKCFKEKFHQLPSEYQAAHELHE